MSERRRPESARLVVLDQHNRIFLFRHQDSQRTYWVTPGGGVEPGESWEQAAVRELCEETGVVGAPLEGWVARREWRGDLAGKPVQSVERYYLVRAEPELVHTRNQLAHEREVYQQFGWWSVDELRTSSETAYPAGLADLLDRLIEDGIPEEPVSLPAEDDDQADASGPV